jgi:hypothetical protein
MIPGLHGLCFRHNDYLNITRDLGLPVLLIIGFFLFGFFKRFRYRFLDMACLCVLIICCFQTTLYFPKNAIWVVGLFAVREIWLAR